MNYSVIVNVPIEFAITAGTVQEAKRLALRSVTKDTNYEPIVLEVRKDEESPID